MRLFPLLFVLMGVVVPGFAQKEFLTPSEIELIREAQDPNLRLRTYLQFAKQRMDQLNQQVMKDKKGRSILIRDILDQYVQIIDAIDTVSDDALKRKVDIAQGADAVSGSERGFLGTLKKLEASKPADLDMYAITLKEAIAITEDSMGTADQDLTRRQTTLLEKAEDEKVRIQAATAPKVLQEQAKENAKAEEPRVGDGSKRKPPTLLRPGEKAPATNKP